jgi:hypothetical protein
MANIKVKNLTSITGADLFNDPESFMRDLSEDELTMQGGLTPAIGVWILASSYSLVAFL